MGWWGTSPASPPRSGRDKLLKRPEPPGPPTMEVSLWTRFPARPTPPAPFPPITTLSWQSPNPGEAQIPTVSHRPHPSTSREKNHTAIWAINCPWTSDSVDYFHHSRSWSRLFSPLLPPEPTHHTSRPVSMPSVFSPGKQQESPCKVTYPDKPLYPISLIYFLPFSSCLLRPSYSLPTSLLSVSLTR